MVSSGNNSRFQNLKKKKERKEKLYEFLNLDNQVHMWKVMLLVKKKNENLENLKNPNNHFFCEPYFDC